MSDWHLIKPTDPGYEAALARIDAERTARCERAVTFWQARTAPAAAAIGPYLMAYQGEVTREDIEWTERCNAAEFHGCEPDNLTPEMLQVYYDDCDAVAREEARQNGWPT